MCEGIAQSVPPLFNSRHCIMTLLSVECVWIPSVTSPQNMPTILLQCGFCTAASAVFALQRFLHCSAVFAFGNVKDINTL